MIPNPIPNQPGQGVSESRWTRWCFRCGEHKQAKGGTTINARRLFVCAECRRPAA
jgi:hypothetical protein